MTKTQPLPAQTPQATDPRSAKMPATKPGMNGRNSSFVFTDWAMI